MSETNESISAPNFVEEKEEDDKEEVVVVVVAVTISWTEWNNVFKSKIK